MICVKWLKKKKTGGKCLSENEQQENDRRKITGGK